VYGYNDNAQNICLGDRRVRKKEKEGKTAERLASDEEEREKKRVVPVGNAQAHHYEYCARHILR